MPHTQPDSQLVPSCSLLSETYPDGTWSAYLGALLWCLGWGRALPWKEG